MRHLSGEGYEAQYSSPSQPRHRLAKIVGVALVILAILGGVIYVGLTYERDRTQQNGSNAAQDSSSDGDNDGLSSSAGGGDSNNGHRGTGGGSLKGTVATASAQSISVTLSDGTTRTYAITEDTTISNAATQSFGSSDSGQADAGSIKAGDTVLVTPDPSDNSEAVGILINPQ